MKLSSQQVIDKLAAGFIANSHCLILKDEIYKGLSLVVILVVGNLIAYHHPISS